MQNKGIVRFFAIALTLVCIFYLSFSVVTNYYENKAKKIANGDERVEQAYLDSLANEKVYFGNWTLKDCRETAIGLGLDLKGGMNVILEVSVPDVIKTLADNKPDPAFNTAIENASRQAVSSQEDVITLFIREYHQVAPGQPLSGLFATQQLRGRVDQHSTDAQVESVLREEVKAAVENSFNVLRTRIDRFGVVQPNIQNLEDNMGRIMVELPGIKEPERVRKLLQGSANLEFWETYDATEIAGYLQNADAALRNVLANNGSAQTSEKAAPAEAISTSDSIANALRGTDTASEADLRREYPLLSILQVSNYAGPIAGYVNVKDTAEVNRYLAMPEVQAQLPRDLSLKWGVAPADGDPKKQTYELYAIKVTSRNGKAPLEGDVVVDAQDEYDQYSRPAVSMQMNNDGARRWSQLTKENIGKSIAIVLDNYVYSAPNVNQQIDGGRSQITGNFTIDATKDLANVLKSGKMPAPAHIVQEDVVGPSLGQEAIHAGLISFIVAFCMILIYMVFYYGLVPGLIADFALICNVFFIFGVLASFKAVLTLPGIAGVVLTLGMAVDANVLIYERIREELRSGKSIKNALAAGYKNAFSAIIDSNVTTVLTGIILFIFGTGPIKGFATTLIIGVLCSFFTAIFISRVIFEWLLNKSEKYNDLQFVTNITKGWFQNTNIDFIAQRKIFYIISSVVILVGLASIGLNGMKKGVDFSGGRNYIVRFEQPVSTVEVMDLLKPSFDASVITIGNDNQVRITTNYKIMEDDPSVDSEIEGLIYNALKSKLSNGVSEEMFLNRYVLDDNGTRISNANDSATFGLQSSQKVGPTMADDIKTSAFFAVLISLIVIFVYILIRFHNVAFGVGAVVSLVHDTLIIFGLFSLLQNVMPFSMEIDQSFVAAILTVIGYSINDNVVIFDRIRENIELYPKRDIKSTINASLNATLSRTFSTSMSTLVVLIVIFFFGGETIRGFIFAMLVGVIVGTYSSWFIATPIAYDTLKKNGAKSLKKVNEAVAENA